MEKEDLLLNEMEAKRTAITNKLEALEDNVIGTVEGATSKVNETVEVIKDTVEETVATVKETVEGTVNTVKETVEESLAKVKGLFDVEGHVRAHPWLTMGGAVGLGYWLGAGGGPYVSRNTMRKISPGPATGRSAPRFFEENGLDLGPELAKLRGLALGFLVGAARDAILPRVPESMKTSLGEIFESVNKKVGGAPLSSPAFGKTSEESRREQPDFSQQQKTRAQF